MFQKMNIKSGEGKKTKIDSKKSYKNPKNGKIKISDLVEEKKKWKTVNNGKIAVILKKGEK